MSHQHINRRSSTPCPRCKRLISINADSCIHCGLARPKIYLSIPILRDLITGKISFVDSIVLLCLVLYVLALLLDITGLSLIGGNILNLLRPAEESLYKLGMGGRIPLAMGRWWTMITATYLHGSILHIGFNMLWLRRIGPLVEELFGASRFWIIYTISGLFGSILTTIMGTYFFVGASGAIFGLLAGFAMLFPNTQLMLLFPPIPIKAKYFVPIIAAADLFLGLSSYQTGIAHFAHLGGALVGFLLIINWHGLPGRR